MLRKQDICFGKKPVLEALLAGQPLERIFLRKGIADDVIRQINGEAARRQVPVSYVPKEKLSRLTNLNHQGVVALLSPIAYFRVEDIVDQCFSEGRDPLVVVLDGVTDVGNFGAICRSALGLGADAVVIGYYRSAAVNAQAVKASAGALHHLRVCRHRDLAETLDYLRSAGLKVAALEGRGEAVLGACDLAGPLALLAGSEGEGIDEGLLQEGDLRMRIPMQEKLESFNVSVSVALALWEASRSRRAET